MEGRAWSMIPLVALFSLAACFGQNGGSGPIPGGEKVMKIMIGNETYPVIPAENSSTEALRKALEKGPLTIEMRDYGNMEKVGPLGMSLPRNDEQITTRAGDIILYQGNALVIYYEPNSWSFTRIGRIGDISKSDLKKLLGKGSVRVTLFLE